MSKIITIEMMNELTPDKRKIFIHSQEKDLEWIKTKEAELVKERKNINSELGLIRSTIKGKIKIIGILEKGGKTS